MHAWVALLLLTPALLAGCTGLQDDGDAFVTAHEHLDMATSEADRWNTNAQLVGVIGSEPSAAAIEDASNDSDPNATDGSPFTKLAQVEDPVRPDGRAQAWTYVFKALPGQDDASTFSVTVAANGTLLAAEEIRDQDPEAPVEGWEVDSDEAVQVAKEHNATWANATDPRSTIAVLFGGEDGDDPLWLLGLEGDNEGDESWVFVNATTGAYLGGFGMDMGPFAIDLGPGAEWGSSSGQTTVTEPVYEVPFTIDHEDHPKLLVTLDVDMPSPVTSVTLSLRSPGGQTVDQAEATMQQPSVQLQVGQPVTGDWTATAEMNQGAAEQVWIGWCATGFGPFGPWFEERPHPCNER